MNTVERHPCDVPKYDRIISGLQNGLGHEEFDRLRDEGGGTSLDDAVKLAPVWRRVLRR